MEAKKKIQMIQEYGKWELNIPLPLFSENVFNQETWENSVGQCPPRGRHQGGIRCAETILGKYIWKKVGETDNGLKNKAVWEGDRQERKGGIMAPQTPVQFQKILPRPSGYPKPSQLSKEDPDSEEEPILEFRLYSVLRWSSRGKHAFFHNAIMDLSSIVACLQLTVFFQSISH